MQSIAEFSPDERDLILKALSYYQIHLFDEIAKSNHPAEADYKSVTTVIKKIHGAIEKHN